MLRLLWHDYRYFPYERVLAEREARLLYGVEPEEAEDGLVVESRRGVGARLTYVKAVQNGKSLVVPDQAKLEASAAGNGSAWNPEVQPIPSVRRQSTRYSAHGLHEYRGKFNPQVVRAIGNLMGLEPGDWVLDPFCGSGTTVLEAAHIGWNAIGIDLNPLGVLIANAKITAFNASPTTLARQCEALAASLDPLPDGSDWRSHLPEPEHLENWFPVRVLEKLRAILKAIEAVRPIALQDVFRVILSDICRDVSLQDPGDLRIRRRKEPADDYPAAELFLESMRAKVGAIVRARGHVQPQEGTTQFAILGDTRDAAGVAGVLLANRRRKAFDAAITSPPYATAMPYLDTQRLSLALLGMMGSRELRHGERQQIGNREIQDKVRLSLEGEIRENTAQLPDSVIAFCRRLLQLADHTSHGFRRRNVPALVYKYLSDMASMFASVLRLVRPAGRYALLVGRNCTELRGEEVQIDTPQLLADIAASRGWTVEETVAFETYHRFDVHQSNSIREEILIVLSRP
jgi:site-specific DNA-methyltransferase (cytosine-N4-specific)